jgi:hypothetical protein
VLPGLILLPPVPGPHTAQDAPARGMLVAEQAWQGSLVASAQRGEMPGQGTGRRIRDHAARATHEPVTKPT